MRTAIAGTGTKSVGFREKKLPTPSGTVTVSSRTVHTRGTTRTACPMTLPVIVTAVLKVNEHQFLFLIVLSPFQQQDVPCKKGRTMRLLPPARFIVEGTFYPERRSESRSEPAWEP